MDILKYQSVQIWNPKPAAFIIFADLDGTFTPMDIKGKVDFANAVQEIYEEGNIQVKFVPVSGRPSGYVLRVLHDTRDMLSGMEVGKVCDFGAAEQGALIVDSSRSYGPQYIGDTKTLGLKERVAKIIQASPHAKILKDEPDKIYTCSIHIINEAKADMDHAAQRKVYESIRDDILKEYGSGILDIAMSHNCMEVMSKEISKAKAVDRLLWRYRKEYNVVGMVYAGDAENDKVAIVYTSKLAEIPGMAAHVFEPANAQSVIDSDHLEGWKNKNRYASNHRIRKGDFTMFRGITQLLRDELKKGTLFGRGTGVKNSLGLEALQWRKKIYESEKEAKQPAEVAAKMAELKEDNEQKNHYTRPISHRKYSLFEPIAGRGRTTVNSYLLPNFTRKFSTTADFQMAKNIVDAL